MKLLIAILFSCIFCCNDETFEEMNEPEYKVESVEQANS
jgi:hypothetical protein